MNKLKKQNREFISLFPLIDSIQSSEYDEQTTLKTCSTPGHLILISLNQEKVLAHRGIPSNSALESQFYRPSVR